MLTSESVNSLLHCVLFAYLRYDLPLDGENVRRVANLLYVRVQEVGEKFG